MNKLVSGAIGVPIKITGTRIDLPDILELKGKRIKHIDFADLVKTTTEGQIGVGELVPVHSMDGAFISLMEQNTKTYKIKDLPLKQLALSINHGNRLFINKIIDFPNSYIDFPALLDNNAFLGKIIFLVFWYDEPLIMQRIQEGGKTTIQSFEVDVFDLNFRRINFGDNRTLVGKKFRNMFFQHNLGVGKTPTGKIPVDFYTARSSFVNLQLENLKYIKNIPVYIFYQTENFFPIRLQNIVFDFLNSYIEVAPTVTLQPYNCYFFNAEIDDND